jgi:uncharacterized protein YndB with AHSA1/START domain
MNAEPVTASIRTDAPPAAVFQYFTDAEKLLRWQGQHVKIDAVPGGRFAVDINGIPVRGEFVEVVHPYRIVLTWGHAAARSSHPGRASSRSTSSATTAPP